MHRNRRSWCLASVISENEDRIADITAYLENGGTIENAQAIAAHESPRTTKLYDRTSDEVTLDEIERIVINWGAIPEIRRNIGTVQKDWAFVKSNALPEDMCIAVRGHQGWSHDPDSVARYTLAVTFEIVGQEIPIYEPLRAAALELESEVEAEMEAEIEVETEE